MRLIWKYIVSLYLRARTFGIEGTRACALLWSGLTSFGSGELQHKVVQNDVAMLQNRQRGPHSQDWWNGNHNLTFYLVVLAERIGIQNCSISRQLSRCENQNNQRYFRVCGLILLICCRYINPEYTRHKLAEAPQEFNALPTALGTKPRQHLEASDRHLPLACQYWKCLQTNERFKTK